jgi:hypothetical protein
MTKNASFSNRKLPAFHPEFPDGRWSTVLNRKVCRSSGRMNVVNEAGLVNRRDRANRSINRCRRKIRKRRWQRAIASGTIKIGVAKEQSLSIAVLSFSEFIITGNRH